MKEPEENTKYFCKDCSDFLAKKIDTSKITGGDFIKVAFDADDPMAPNVRKEHMWLEVRKVMGTSIFATLANVPNHVSTINYGSPTIVSIDEVEDHLTEEEMNAKANQGAGVPRNGRPGMPS